MAIVFNSAKFLAKLHSEKASFGRTLTLGRMNWLVRPENYADLRAVLLAAGLPPEGIGPLFSPDRSVFAEDFFRLLGSEGVDAMDYSDYEGASIVHDLNQPIPADLENTFDLVYDGGCLEHVFNYPVGLANCLRMARVGGRVVLHTPCNNQAGHGFYQFSPELFFRVFSAENGFELEHVLIHETFRAAEGSAWYAVRDPAALGKRVGLDAGAPTMLLVSARKVEHVPPFRQPPLQSDYKPLWREAQSGSGSLLSKASGVRGRLERSFPRAFTVARTLFNYPLRNKEYFGRLP